MSHPEIIIPFALPPAEHAKDLARLLASECGSEGLAMLLSRSHTIRRDRFDDFSVELPHEQWLSKQHQHNELNHRASSLSLPLSEGYWFLLHPVNLHIASNHLVLTDFRQLTISDLDSRTLFDKAQSLSAELGNIELVYGDACHWFLRADDWSDFVTASPDAASGHNIEIWSPQGKQILAWRKLQNEIQMEWFIHPVQEQRQQRGEKVINGLWLWSGTLVQKDAKPGNASPLRTNPNPADFIQSPQLTLIDPLSPSALAGDWGTWAQAMIELERTWFRPLVAALKAGQIKNVNLVLSNSNTLLQVQTSANSLRRFWRSANFNQLI
jgi:hypothetical protein